MIQKYIIVHEVHNSLLGGLPSLNLPVSTSKSVTFFRRRKLQITSIMINNTIIPQVNEMNYLGLGYDWKFTWHAHVTCIASKLARNTNLVKILSGVKWGTHPSYSKIFFNGLIYSITDFGIQFYYNRKTAEHLSVIINQCVRRIFGFLQSTPTNATYTECGIPPIAF